MPGDSSADIWWGKGEVGGMLTMCYNSCPILLTSDILSCKPLCDCLRTYRHILCKHLPLRLFDPSVSLNELDRSSFLSRVSCLSTKHYIVMAWSKLSVIQKAQAKCWLWLLLLLLAGAARLAIKRTSRVVVVVVVVAAAAAACVAISLVSSEDIDGSHAACSKHVSLLNFITK